jgi:hypothetical protein
MSKRAAVAARFAFTGKTVNKLEKYEEHRIPQIKIETNGPID